MIKHAPAILLLLCLTTVAWAIPLLDLEGTLAADDDTLETGAFYKQYGIDIEAGLLVTVKIASAQFPACVAALTSDGRYVSAEPEEGERTASLQFISLEAGELGVVACGQEAGQQGAYTLAVETRELEGGVQSLQALLDTEGTLSKDDQTFDRDQFFDLHVLDVAQGDVVRVSVESSEFDAFLMVQTPAESMLLADDVRGRNPELTCVAETDGQLALVVTSAEAGKLGRYRVMAMKGRLAPDPAQTPAAAGDDPPAIADEGALGPDSQTLDSGEFAEIYAIAVQAGQEYTIRLDTEGFQGYLMIAPPGGETMDAEATAPGEPLEVTVTSPEDGKLRLWVTTSKVGEQGAFRMSFKPTQPAGEPAAATPADAEQPPTEQTEEKKPEIPPPPTFEGTKLGDPLDPKLRLPIPKPAPGTVQDPGVLAQTLYKMNHIYVEVGGWSEMHEENWLYGPLDPTVPDRFHTSPRRFYFEVDNQFGNGDHFTVPLEWTGNIFTCYYAYKPDDKGSVEVVDVVGTVTPNGDRIERVTIRFYAQHVYVDPDTGEKLLKYRAWKGATLTDLPLITWGWEAWDLPRFTTMAEHLRTNILDLHLRNGFFYGYANHTEAGEHVLDMGYLVQDPSRRSHNYILADEIHTVSHKSTNWLNADGYPTAKVGFEIYKDALER